MIAAGRKKRVSKKAPKSWRKHVNISDVENFLEEKRVEERMGKPLEAKSNEELFHLDTKVDKKFLSKQEKRELLTKKPIKCFTPLVNTSKIQDPRGHRDKIRTRDDGINASMKRLKRSRGIIPNKEKIAQEQRLRSKQEKEKRKNRSCADMIFKNDVWEMEEKPIPEELKNTWISENVVKHTLRNTRKLSVKAPQQIRDKRSKLKAIDQPHPGISYNPTLDDHNDLMRKAIEKEKTIIKEEEHLNRVTTAQFSKVTPEERDRQNDIDMKAGLDLDNENDADVKDENASDDNEYSTTNPPVKNKKKDKQKRRKQREQKEIKRQLAKSKIEKQKITDIHKLRHLKKSIDSKATELEIARLERKKKMKHREYQPKRIGPIKFTESEIDVVMPQELPGSLRSIRADKSILQDRIASLQKRNIVAPAKHCGIRSKAKIKKFINKEHRVTNEKIDRIMQV